MLYKKNASPRLDKKLFKHPTAEYRGTPFWAWNCKLEREELEWQLEILKQMGFGGAHIHVRTGMSTEYLSDEYMALIKACVEKAKKEEMLAWLYDEDRWPSGAAGGLVTKDKKYRARYLLFTSTPYRKDGLRDEEAARVRQILAASHSAEALRAENGNLLACYDIELDEAGYLKSWKRIDMDAPAEHEKWYAYLETNMETPWFNNQTYINTLDKKAMDRFIEITYEAYNRTIANEFDKTVPAIFTDEPQVVHKSTLSYAKEKKDVILPWADDFADTFADAYEGADILTGIPEVIWERADGKAPLIRHHYHDHVCERFVTAFVDNCGKWCKEHGLELTGHMMNESTLRAQTVAMGEVMRSYRGFGIPGIDMLFSRFEYTTAKQAQSAVHQYGREAMMSELYGVTNWDFDFRGHKLHGDWQAALGATIRVPHLSWVSMAGEAKRDYPASIHYQSPWWNQYSLVEDHFARVNTAMTRGKAIVKVGVIHPIESYWLHYGPSEQTSLLRDSMDDNFQNLTKWLLFGGIDFDFISESLLPDLCIQSGAPLRVGEMEYDIILVPGCETLRSTTLERLEGFVNVGGKLIFVGDIPTLENVCPSTRGSDLAKQAECVAFNRGTILQAVESARMVEIRNASGALTDNLLYQLRQDGEGRWLFVAHGTEPYNKDVCTYEDLRIRVEGTWKVSLYNTMNGEIEDIKQNTEGTMTEVFCRMYDYDSVLLWLEPLKDLNEAREGVPVSAKAAELSVPKPVPLRVPYTLSEPNVLLLDQAEYALDDGAWQPEEEILRLDDACRIQLGWPSRKHSVAQPWVIKEKPVTHTVHLRFYIQSDIEYKGAQLAIEDAECLKLKWNGKKFDNTVIGWYVDKAIKTVALPDIQIGNNILEVSIPFGERTNVEWAYILGDFGVEVLGGYVHIIPARKELAFGDITIQGLPFYGGNVTYHIPVKTEEGKLEISSTKYRGILQTICLDDGPEVSITFPPYKAEFDSVSAGEHIVHLTLYGHRRNSFGPVHLANLAERYIGPGAWRSENEKWTYDYMICEESVATPVIVQERE